MEKNPECLDNEAVCVACCAVQEAAEEDTIKAHGHSPEHTHGEHGEKAELLSRLMLALGAALFLTALLFRLPFWAEVCLYAACYLLAGGEVLLQAARNLRRGRMLDENFLMGIASLGAFAIGQYPEGAAVMLFYRVGELMEDLAVERSKKSIASHMDIRPEYANLKTGGGTKRVSPEEVRVGDLILVKPGEKIPLDGVVAEGSSFLDTAALTGESMPRSVSSGDEVLSGSINKNGLLTVRVTREYGESTVSKILALVEDAAGRKARTEQFITKFARYYTPAVVGAAVALAVLPPLLLPGAGFGEWFRRALVFLVVSCPCALVISVPLAFFGGIGGASRNGILVKGGTFLEALSNVHTVVFDKTGTLTKGVFRVKKIEAAGGFSQTELLRYASYAERYSDHPIAQSVRAAYGEGTDDVTVEAFSEIPGFGVRAVVQGKTILAGNKTLLKRENVSFAEAQTSGTVLHLAVNGTYAGFLEITDEVKEDGKKAMEALRFLGVKRIVMLTGDDEAAAKAVGRDLGIEEVHFRLLPQDKVERTELLARQMPAGGKLVFVGDGINDAPVLARADVGVAMGGLGRDAAMEAADVVLMTDELGKLADAIAIARRTRKIAWQNIAFALSVKGIFLLMGAGGIATMWEAEFADVGVALLAVLNALRVLKPRKAGQK
jgi:Cd2+/Zn2+-exporting ATPase